MNQTKLNGKRYCIKHPAWGRFCGEFLGGGFWEFPPSTPKLEPIVYMSREAAQLDLVRLINANPVHRPCRVVEEE